VEAGGGIEWVPLIGGGGEVPFIKGIEREFYSMEKKREGNRNAAGEFFLASDPLYHYFFTGDGKWEMLKFLLRRHPCGCVCGGLPLADGGAV
jgi:hypothetical protein